MSERAPPAYETMTGSGHMRQRYVGWTFPQFIEDTIHLCFFGICIPFVFACFTERTLQPLPGTAMVTRIHPTASFTTAFLVAAEWQRCPHHLYPLNYIYNPPEKYTYLHKEVSCAAALKVDGPTRHSYWRGCAYADPTRVLPPPMTFLPRVSPDGTRPPAYEPSPTNSPTRGGPGSRSGSASSFRPLPQGGSARSSIRSRVAGGSPGGQYTPSG